MVVVGLNGSKMTDYEYKHKYKQPHRRKHWQM